MAKVLDSFTSKNGENYKLEASDPALMTGTVNYYISRNGSIDGLTSNDESTMRRKFEDLKRQIGE